MRERVRPGDGFEPPRSTPAGQHQESRVATAFELAAYADRALRDGDLQRARDLMSQAAGLDGGYTIRAKHLGGVDPRRVSPSRTISRLLIAPLVEAGCGIQPPGPWTATSYLLRAAPPWTLTLIIGAQKFGGGIGVNAGRSLEGRTAEWYHFAAVGLPSGRIYYVSQRELEEACVRWRDVLTATVLPWGHEAAEGAG